MSSADSVAPRRAVWHEALTINEDGAKRYADFHRPDGFHPEQADLFAHNEIVVKASCNAVWAHLSQAE